MSQAQMLNSLRAIVQDVNTARDLPAALTSLVARIKRTMATDVCSVYLYDPLAHRYVLMATEGLNPDAVGFVGLEPNEGLVGMVAAREEPINLEHADNHPNFLYFPETGEERYGSFLGVPIIHHRHVLGVLVVQQAARRRFDEDEEAFLVTLSAQIAGVIAHAEATGALEKMTVHGRPPRQAKFTGLAGAPGVCLGTAVVALPEWDLNAVPNTPGQGVEREMAVFHEGLHRARQEIKALGETLASQLNPEEQALFDVYLRMLDDGSLAAEVVQRIRAGESAQYAWSQVILAHVNIFSNMEDAYLRERATDVRDLGLRVLSHMAAEKDETVDYPDQTILVGEELTATLLGEVPREKLAGLVSVRGSSNSHVAILARAMGVPTVMGAVDLPFTQVDGRELVIDGYNGVVFIEPSGELRQQFQALIAEEQQLSEGLEKLKAIPCETRDHHRVPLWVNTGLMADVQRSLDRGAEGVGLYRTEVPFLIRDRFPTEEEQRAIYREQLEAFAPKPVTMRTLDIGGDKALPYFPIEEANPFLGWRGIRVTLDHPELFLAQVRAMMKASHGLNNLRIMLPMISSVGELDAAQGLVRRAFHELLEEGFELTMPPVGVMVEVPAAVYQARELAARSDFLSVGSNDLTQYLLAVDRNNARVAGLYHSYHPAVLRALRAVVDGGHQEGRPVGICGELAGDPRAAMLLIAMGFDVLSMSATNLPRVKAVLREVSLSEAQALLDDVLLLSDAAGVIQRLEQALAGTSVERYLHPINVGAGNSYSGLVLDDPA